MSISPKQRDLVDSLYRERDIPDQVREIAERAFLDPTLSAAQQRPIIDELFTFPKKARAAGPAGPAKTDHVLRDLEIPPAMYAIPAGALLPALRTAAQADANDHAFFAVGEYRETRYIRILHGAPGSFSRTKLPSREDEQAIARVIHAFGTLQATQLFGSLYTCCGKCGAELTDKTSRALKLGPHCRKEFGL